MNKKIIMYLAILAVIIILGGVAVFIFFSPSSPFPANNKIGDVFPETSDVTLFPTPIGDSEIASSSIPQSNAILNFTVSAANISSDGKIVAISTNGEIFKSDLDGMNQTKQTLALGSFSRAVISPDGQKILKFSFDESQDKKSLAVLDLEKNKEYPLSASDILESPAFSSDSKSIFFKYTNKANNINFFASSNFDLSGLKELFPLGFLERELRAWGSDKILFTSKPSGLVFSDSYFFSLKEKKLKKAVSGYGLSMISDREGNRLAYSKTDAQGKNVSLSIFNPADNSSREIGIKTFAEKCVFLATPSAGLLCATPVSLSTSLVFPDSYYQKIFSPNDNIIIINPENSVVIKFKNLSKNNSFDITNPFVSLDEKYLFFINGKDSKLHRIEL